MVAHKLIHGTAHPLPRMFGIKRAARRLDVSEKTLRRGYTNGLLAVDRIGRRVLVSEDELIRFRNAGESQRKPFSMRLPDLPKEA